MSTHVSNQIPLSYPDITDAEIDAVADTLRSGRLSIGPKLEEFEFQVADRARRMHGIGVNSGTSGLHLVLAALGIGPGDEVITPAFSFVASANCVEYVGAKPVFADCDPRTLNVRAETVKSLITEKTKAIIGVEVFGNPTGIGELATLAAKHEIPLIEDACEGIGGALKGDPIGHFGRAAVFGFYPNKQITTGEGGMIVTDDDRLADICRSMRNQGRPCLRKDQNTTDEIFASWLTHERLGYNFRLNEICATLGVEQMKRLDEMLEARQFVAEAYMRRLGGNPHLILPTIESDVFMSWFVFVVRLNDQFTRDDRDEILKGLRRHDVGAGDYFPPIPLLQFYRKKYGYKPGDFAATESVSQRTIALPFYTKLRERDIDLICQTLELMISRITFARD